MEINQFDFIKTLGGEFMEAIRNFWKDESGSTAVEYGLLIALIACVVISTVTSLGTDLKNKFNTVATSIGGGS